MNRSVAFISVCLFFSVLLSYGQNQDFGIYSLKIPAGWVYREDFLMPEKFVFSNSGSDLTVMLSKQALQSTNNDEFSKNILNIIQQNSKNDEYVELRKPSVLCQVLGQKTTHLIIVKSRDTGARRIVLNPLAGKRLYQIEITGNIGGLQIPVAATNFLKSIGLSDGSVAGLNAENNSDFPDSPSENTSESKNTFPSQSTGIAFTAPNENLPDGKRLSITPKPLNLDILKDLIEPEQLEKISKEIRVAGIYELGPDGYYFSTPAVVRIPLKESELPSGYSFKNLGFVLVSGGDIENVPFKVTSDGIMIEVQHCSYLMGALITTALIGTMGGIAALSLYLKGSTEPMNRRDCAKWIDTNNTKIREIANDPNRFKIDSKGDIFADVGAKMKGMNVGQGNHFIKPGNFINKPEGDCVNFSSLYGSLLAAKGYPVRMVAGNAEYPGYKGGHQWIETVIDGKIYYVDTYTPSKSKLVPIEVARKHYKLNPGKMCYPESPKNYDNSWYENQLTSKNPDLDRYYELRSEHRVLQEFCVSGVESACKDATEIYREAMEIRKKLEAKGIKVVQ
jgi:hypothetical protein